MAAGDIPADLSDADLDMVVGAGPTCTKTGSVTPSTYTGTCQMNTTGTARACGGDEEDPRTQTKACKAEEGGGDTGDAGDVGGDGGTTQPKKEIF